MRKVPNKQIARAFREARVYIENSQQTYICSSIYALGQTGKISTDVSAAARDIISVRMDQMKYLEGWLYANSESFKAWYQRTNFSDLRNQMRLYRLRWLDALIEEFDKKG